MARETAGEVFPTARARVRTAETGDRKLIPLLNDGDDAARLARRVRLRTASGAPRLRLPRGSHRANRPAARVRYRCLCDRVERRKQQDES